MNIHYVALLRGINISGQKLIRMAELKLMFEQLDLHQVSTYLQTGNILFDSPEPSRHVLQTMIQQQIQIRFQFDVPVLVLALTDIAQIVQQNPFRERNLEPGDGLYFTLLYQPPQQEHIQTLMAYLSKTDDEIYISDRCAYLLCHKGYGRALLNNNFIENKLRVQATTRNLNTMTKLLEVGRS